MQKNQIMIFLTILIHKLYTCRSKVYINSQILVHTFVFFSYRVRGVDGFQGGEPHYRLFQADLGDVEK